MKMCFTKCSGITTTFRYSLHANRDLYNIPPERILFQSYLMSKRSWIAMISMEDTEVSTELVFFSLSLLRCFRCYK